MLSSPLYLQYFLFHDCGVDTGVIVWQSGVEASPKNRYVWQAWALFEAKEGNEERARQLFQRGQELNPKDPVLFQSYGLFEYNCGHLAIARALFKRGIAVAPQHQPLWIVRYL